MIGMAEVKGKRVICDRCRNETFRALIGKEDFGFSSQDKFEEMPEDWLYVTEIGWLCSDCAGGFKRFVTEFAKGKLAPAWQWKGARDIDGST